MDLFRMSADEAVKTLNLIDQPSEVADSREGASDLEQSDISCTEAQILTKYFNKMSKPVAALSFLHPCHTCQGDSYLFGKDGFFICSNCNPAAEGISVIGSGNISQIEINRSQSVIGAGPEYRRIDNRFKLASECFKIGYPWVKDHIDELCGAGWTKPELFRRSPHRWPLGNWGLAWLGVWRRPGVRAMIVDKGKIIFTFKYNGRTVTQSANPVC